MSHVCGRGCPEFDYLSRVLAQQVVFDGDCYNVVLPCRICGEDVVLEVPGDYGWAVSQFHQQDDHPRVHYKHVELTNWGVHWRFDDVLFVLFPKEHTEELWPMTEWWKNEYGTPMYEEFPIEVLSKRMLQERQPSALEIERRMLVSRINRYVNDKEELLEQYNSVWSTDDLRKEFDVYNFQAPFVIARRIATDEIGTLLFQDNPRYYFGWVPDDR